MSDLTTSTDNLPIVARVRKALGFTDETEKTLKEMAERTKTIVKITDQIGYEQVHSARMALKNQRLEITRRGKAAREDATAFSKGCIAEENRLIGIIEPEETRLHRLQKEVDDEKERQRQELIEAEKRRVQGIQREIEQIRMLPTYAMGKSSQYIQELLTQAEALTIGESFEEFAEQATSARNVAVVSLRGILAERNAFEAEQARVKAERAELEKLRAEEAERRAADAKRKVEEDRARDEERKRLQDANERNVAAWQEIQAINHQLLIADTGRAPYIQGGTVEGIELLISETEEWEVTVDKFGMLLETAERMKAQTLEGLRMKLDSVRKDRELANQIAEQNRLSAEIADASRAEVSKKAAETFERTLAKPSPHEMVNVLAEFYGVSTVTVVEWITSYPPSAYSELACGFVAVQS